MARLSGQAFEPESSSIRQCPRSTLQELKLDAPCLESEHQPDSVMKHNDLEFGVWVEGLAQHNLCLQFKGRGMRPNPQERACTPASALTHTHTNEHMQLRG